MTAAVIIGALWIASLILGWVYHLQALERVTLCEPAQSALEERADVLAVLRQRRANHDLVASRPTGLEERATWLRREMDILIGDIEAGLHEGRAAVAPMLQEETD